MSAKTQVYLWASLLIVLGISLIAIKAGRHGIPLTPGKYSDVWVVESLIEFEGQGKPVKIKAALPNYFSSYELITQRGAANGFGFSTEGEEKKSKGVWSAREVTKGKNKIYYTFSFYDTGELPKKITENKYIADAPFFEEPYQTAALALTESAWKKSADNTSYAKQIISRLHSAQPDQNINLLRSLIKDNYTEVDLTRDLIYFKEVPAAVIKGLKLEDGERKVHANNFLAFYDKSWSIINPISGEVGIPDETVFWTQPSILEVEGCTNSKISFSMIKSEQSAKTLAIDNSLAEDSALMSFSIYSLPLEYQSIFKLLLIIPVGALIVVVIRNLVGISTSGTFMPILLAIAFLETTLSKGLVILFVMMTLGLLIRMYLSKMNLLLVPRISAVVICVVMLMGFISVVSYKLGLADGVSVTFFPMIIISWTIERTSIMWEEHGGQEVLEKMGGSLLVSIVVYLVMTNTFVRYFTFTFPEVMLLMLAFVLLIGIYTGYRLTELFRFEPLVKQEDLDS